MYAGARPSSDYSPANERAWELYTGAAPAYYGRSGGRLLDLAEHIANDERFVACTVKRVYEGMLGRKVVLADEGAVAEHREAFLESGLSLKALVRSVLTEPSYRGRAWQPRFGGAPEPVAKKLAPVDVLADSLTELSVYRMTLQGRSAIRLDSALRTLAGGSDRGDAMQVSTGAVLVQRRLAEAGAMHAIAAAAGGESTGGILCVCSPRYSAAPRSRWSRSPNPGPSATFSSSIIPSARRRARSSRPIISAQPCSTGSRPAASTTRPVRRSR